MCEKQKAGIYVHIPFCRSRCAYCGFVSSVGRFDPWRYVSALTAEIEERVSGEVDSVFVGGGTPSVLPRGALTRILQAIARFARLSANCEITAEANPDSCTPEFVREAADCGVNRISLGVQSLNDGVLARIGRRHNAAQVTEALQNISAAGIGNMSCDLMLGLPAQTEQDVSYAVSTLCESGIPHLSAYALSVEEGTPLHAQGYTVDEDRAADQYDIVCRTAKRYGMERYEVSNFSRPGYECRHNLKYWERAPYIGVGAAAHSFDGKVRSYNTSDIAAYIEGNRDDQSSAVTAAEALEETLMLGLRTRRGVSFARLNEAAGYDWQAAKRPQLQFLTERGYIERTQAGIRLAENAYYVMNEVIVRLL